MSSPITPPPRPRPGTRPRNVADDRMSPDQLAHLDRVLRRLHESMREFLQAWPVADRTPLRLSQRLEIDRTTCQRLTSLAKGGYPGVSILDSLPGPRAFRNVVNAAENVDGRLSRAKLDRLRSAVDGLDEAIQQFGGSMTQMKRRVASASVDAPRPGGSAVDADLADLDARASIVRAATHLTGRHTQSVSSVGLYDRVDVAADMLRHVRVSLNHGVVAKPHAMPLVLETFDGRDEKDSSRWQRSPRLVEKLTSAAWRSVDLEPSRGFASRAMEITRSDTPQDVCVYTEFPVPNPMVSDDPTEESWYILYYPVASLVFDIYLHESIARQCLMSLDVHLWQTSFANAPHGRWQTRLPYAPPIIQLGRGLARAGSSRAQRHREATEEMFELAKVNPEQYIGFRCEEQFPIWRAGYRFELDFGRPDQ